MTPMTIRIVAGPAANDPNYLTRDAQRAIA